MELQAGAVFAGRFRLVRVLGVGGFGEVHEAEELRDGARVALKVLHAEMVAHPTARERFEQEARVTSSFRSAHVVTVIDAGVDGATCRPWVAFEMLTGETLDARLKREPILSRALLARLFEQLGDALGAAHQAGVIHADVKPENLFLVGPVDAPVLKVLDFGIARMLKAGRTSTQVTTEMGSPEWTGPEQFQRGAKLRPSTDVWPLGLIAFRALTGAHYLRSAGPDAQLMPLLTEICGLPLSAASERARELGAAHRLPVDFDRWFCHCVVRAPEERFQHARAAVTALLELLAPRAGVPATVVLSQAPASPWAALRGTVSLPEGTMAAVLDRLASGEWSAARASLDATLAQGEESAELWALRGECDHRLGRYDEAVDDWSRAIVRAPAASAYLHGRALAFEAMGMPHAARADLAALGHEASRQRLTVWQVGAR